MRNKVRMIQKVYILGSSGFIGSRLYTLFSLDKDFETVGFSSKECNLLSPETLEKGLSGIGHDDVVIFAAAITRLTDNSHDSMVKNIQMVENLCIFLEIHPVKQVVFLSTVDVYGFIKPGELIRESILPSPRDHYALSKITGEYMLKMYCLKMGLPLLILRLPGVYGIGGADKSTIGKLVSAAINNGKITVWGDGSDKRDFLYADDIYVLAKIAIDSGTEGTLNVATGNSHSMKEVAEIIADVCNADVTVKHKPVDDHSQERAKDLSYDISSLKTLFPGLKMTSLQKGVTAYLDSVLNKEVYYGS